MQTIGVTTGGWSREELMEAGCAEAYESVAELLERSLIRARWYGRGFVSRSLYRRGGELKFGYVALACGADF